MKIPQMSLLQKSVPQMSVLAVGENVTAQMSVQTYVKLLINEQLASQIANEFAETTSNTIVLHAKRKNAEQIFAAAAGFTSTAGRLWIVNEAAAGAKNLPIGFLNVRLRQSIASALRDALVVVRDGVQFLSVSRGDVVDGRLNLAQYESFKSKSAWANKANKTFPVPPSQCPRGSSMNDNEWTSKIGTLFYKHLISTSFYGDFNPIQFNRKGDRVAISFDILNMHQGGLSTIVGYLSEMGELTLEESAIRWPGGGIRRPLEITLPKHMRVVAVEDPPFVYAIAAQNYDQCANYSSFLIDDVNVNGPWFPCKMLKNVIRNETISNNDNEDDINYSYHSKEMSYCCAGYVIDLLANLSKSDIDSSIDTSFTYEIHLNESYGAVLLNNSNFMEALDGESSGAQNGINSGSGQEIGYVLSGMLGELDSDMADIAIGAFSINPEREKYIDFSEPWHYHGIRILEKWDIIKTPRDSPMQSFLQPLKSTLWTTLFISVFCVGFFIYLLDLKSPFEQFFNEEDFFLAARDENVDNSRVSFGEAMWFVWGVLLNSGVCEKTPRSFSARVLGLVWCGFCMIMVASYTANLAAFLVLDQPERSLNGVNDPRLRNPSANFSYATVLHTNTYQYFKRHVELSTMFRKMEGHNVRSAIDAINALLNDSLGAFIWDSARIDFEASRHCELRARGALFGRSAYGIGLQKNSPWTPHITEKILRLAENGVMERLESKWIHSAGRKSCIYETNKSPTRLSLRNMRDGLILVVFGILIGAILSVLEFRLGRVREKQKKRELCAKRFAANWLSLVKKRQASFHITLLGLTNLTDNQRLSVKSTFNNEVEDKKSKSFSTSVKQWKIFVPNLNFTQKSCKMYCSRCHNAINTIPRACVGRFTVVTSTICIMFCLWPCAVLPFFLTCFADYAHYCPTEGCGHKVGRYRRFRSPQFYV